MDLLPMENQGAEIIMKANYSQRRYYRIPKIHEKEAAKMTAIRTQVLSRILDRVQLNTELIVKLCEKK